MLDRKKVENFTPFKQTSLRPPPVKNKFWLFVYWDDLVLLFMIVASLWAIEFADQYYFSGELQNHGTRPGQWEHWEGIFFSPFLHNGWDHLRSNTSGILVLGSLLLLRGRRIFFSVAFFAAIGAGIFVMLFGELRSNHIGASGVIFGFAFFLMATGFYERSLLTISLSIFAISSYGYLIHGVLPSDKALQENISWEGHLGGAISGILAARFRRRKSSKKEDKVSSL